MLDKFISVAHADVVASLPVAQQPSMIESLAPMFLIMAVFYFLVIRPQSKKAKELRLTLAAVTKGDKIVTAGGVYGEVAKVEADNNILHVKIADNVNIKVKLDSILEVIRETTAVKTK